MERKKGLEVEHIFSHFLTSRRFQHAFSFFYKFSKDVMGVVFECKRQIGRRAPFRLGRQRWHSAVLTRKGGPGTKEIEPLLPLVRFLCLCLYDHLLPHSVASKLGLANKR
jgi:hypothetical protein